MANRTLNLKLPADLIRKINAHAANRGKTIDAFVKELLEDTVDPAGAARRAGQRFLELASKGPSSDVDPGTIRREELYEERFKFLDKDQN